MLSKKSILITGVTGQIGSYLADYSIENDTMVYGMVRRCSQPRYDNIRHLIDNPMFQMVSGDLQDQGSLNRVIEMAKPDYVVNCAAQSFVAESWNSPVNTSDVTGLGVLRLLEAIRFNNHKCNFVQLSSSEMWGNTSTIPQNENTPFEIRSPYGASKLFGHWISINYRESYGMNNRCAICFNNESPRRGIEFVTQKIVTHLAEVAFGKRPYVELGNMETKRDWTHTKDISRALYMIVTGDKNEEYVIGSGRCNTIMQFYKLAYKYIKERMRLYSIKFESKLKTMGSSFKINKKFIRPADVNILCADYSKIKKDLGWKPTVSFEDLVKEMAFAAVDKVFYNIYD